LLRLSILTLFISKCLQSSKPWHLWYSDIVFFKQKICRQSFHHPWLNQKMKTWNLELGTGNSEIEN
jgi:hypothetical protein